MFWKNLEIIFINFQFMLKQNFGTFSAKNNSSFQPYRAHQVATVNAVWTFCLGR